MSTDRVKRKSVRTMIQQSSPPAPPQLEDQAVSLPASSQVVQLPEEPAVKTVKRVKLGWSIREDLIKTCKRLAIDAGTHDYEVLEQLLDEALAARQKQKEEK